MHIDCNPPPTVPRFMISFWVSGRPAPGGSRIPGISKSGKAFHRSASKYEKPWRQAVQAAALIAMKEQAFGLFDGPVEFIFQFQVLRPKCHYKKDGTLKPDAPKYPMVTPDNTKLTRSTEDSLNKIVWHDDKQVVDQHVSKRYADEQGAQICIYEKL